VYDSVIAWLAGRLDWIWVEALAPLGLVIAAIVTVHVLLTKRDVGASIGWIGLAWLSPVLGGIMYYLLGINRVKRRAQRFADRPSNGSRANLPTIGGRDDHLAPLELAARRLTGRHVEPGNALHVYHNGDEAYPPMVAAIAAATTSVALSTYILRDDAAGGRFIEALIAAHRRGVAVRVLVDGFGSGYFLSQAYFRLRRTGVPAARFMHSPLPWRMPFLNLRTHKKLLLIDGKLAFTGGMNIAAENLLATRPRHPVRDTHFRVEGPVVGQLMEAFARDWSFVTDEDLTSPAWFPPLAPAGEAIARVITSGPDLDLEKIEFLVLEAVACARRSIQVVTPYFLPDERLITSLSMAAMRGVAVEIVMPEASNHRLIDWAARANVGPLLSHGGRIWLNPPPFDHSKILVIDGQWSMIGSANFDLRSFRLNFELSMEVYHSDLAETLQAIVRDRKGKMLTEADLLARPAPIRLRDSLVRLLMPYL
jgi:cardiolipin synthase